jgi:hypothetical protein
MINTQGPSQQFLHYVSQRTGVSEDRVAADTRSVPSQADGVAESNIQAVFTSMAKMATFAHDTLKAHPELRDAKPTAEFTEQMQAIEREVAGQPKEALDLCKPLFEDSGVVADPNLQLLPSDVTPGPATGLFAVTFSRMSDDYRDKAPEPFGVGEPRVRLYIDTTPGVDGINYFTEDLSPKPRGEFLQLVSGACNRLPDAVAKDTRMFNASAENPIKAQLVEAMQILADVATVLDGKFDADLDEAGKARLKALEERMNALDEQHPKLREASQEAFDAINDHHKYDNTSPVSVTDHGNGIYSVGMQSRPYDFGFVGSEPKDMTPKPAGTIYLDTRPGLAGYCTYYQPETETAK